jgi:hypothetical protein
VAGIKLFSFYLWKYIVMILGPRSADVVIENLTHMYRKSYESYICVKPPPVSPRRKVASTHPAIFSSSAESLSHKTAASRGVGDRCG